MVAVETRWDEKAGLRTGCGVRSQVIDVLKAQIKRRPAMKKVSTVAAKPGKKISQPKLTFGLDLGDRNSWYCVLEESGQIQLEQRVRTHAKGLREVFGGMPHSRIALEIGTHSPWISRLLRELGHEVIVANARKVRLIGGEPQERRSAGCAEAGAAGRMDPELLYPVKHRSEQAQADLTLIRARAGLITRKIASRKPVTVNAVALTTTRSLPAFFSLLGVVHDIYGVASHTESDLLGVVRLEGNAGGLALPGWSRTLGVWQVVAVRFPQQLLQNRLPSSQLRHHGKEFLSVVGDPAVGDVIAVPATRRIEGVKLGQGDLGDAAGHAID
jgi:hypothetical protein